MYNLKILNKCRRHIEDLLATQKLKKKIHYKLSPCDRERHSLLLTTGRETINKILFLESTIMPTLYPYVSSKTTSSNMMQLDIRGLYQKYDTGEGLGTIEEEVSIKADRIPRIHSLKVITDPSSSPPKRNALDESEQAYLGRMKKLKGLIRIARAKLALKGVKFKLKTPVEQVATKDDVELLLHPETEDHVFLLGDAFREWRPSITKERDISVRINLSELRNGIFIDSQIEKAIKLFCAGFSAVEIQEKLKMSLYEMAALKRKMHEDLVLRKVPEIVIYALKKGIYNIDNFKLEQTLFTEREKRIIRAICLGKDEEQIAKSTLLSLGSVKVYRSNILSRMNGRSVADIVLYAVKYRIIKI